MTEALVLLPFLGLLLVAGQYFHRLHGGAQRARAMARRCSWAHAMAACSGDAVPEDCAPPVPSTASNSQQQQRDRTRDDIDSRASEESQGKTAFDDIGDWPVLGSAFEALFGAGHEVAITAELPGSMLSRRQTVRITRRHWLLCNEREVSGDSVAGQLYDLLPMGD